MPDINAVNKDTINRNEKSPEFAKTSDGKKIYLSPEGAIAARDENELTEITNRMEMIKTLENEIDIKNLLTKEYKGEIPLRRGYDAQLNYTKSMIEELEKGDPSKALNFCLSQSKNDSGSNYTRAIDKLSEWLFKVGKGERLANINIARRFSAELGDKEGEIGHYIKNLIEKDEYTEALQELGEFLVTCEREILRMENDNNPENDDMINDTKQKVQIATSIRNTLLSELKS